MENLLIKPNTSKKLIEKDFWLVLIFSFVTAGAVFGYYLYQNSGILLLCSDFNLQTIPFTIHINDFIKNGGGTWDWSLDLGTGFVEGYSFYNLFSPFLWLTLLLPSTKTIYLIGPLYILKYVVAAITAYAYLKIFVKNNKVAVVGALLFAFSGFQSISLMFQFHDAIALFPLMLLGLEKAMSEKKYSLFVFSVFICCMTNYFIFVSEVIFVILYFLLRFWYLNKREFIKSTLKILLCGALGVGAAAFVFIPNIIYILSSESADVDMWYLDNLWLSITNSLTLIKGLLLPADTMTSFSALQQEAYWDTVSAYLPMMSIFLVVAFICKDVKSWLSKIIIILLVMSFSPILSSVFYCFTGAYHRWWMFLVLMMVLASSYVIDNKSNFNLKKPFVGIISAIILFSIIIIKLPMADGTLNIVDDKKYILQVIVAIVGIIITYLLMLEYKNEKQIIIATIICVSIFSGVTTYDCLNQYANSTGYTVERSSYLNSLEIANNLENYDDQYRYCFDYGSSSETIFEMVGDVAGLTSFSSTVSTSTYEMYRNFGYAFLDIRNRKMSSSQVGGLSELLSGKYVILTDDSAGTYLDSFKVDDKAYYIYEREACPIGFSYDSYVPSSYFENIITTDGNYKGLVALDSLIINDEDVAKVSNYLEEANISELELKYDHSSISDKEESTEVASEIISSLVKKNTDNAVFDFDRNTNGFSCSTSNEKDSVVFFSVPYCKGWTAMVDNTETNIYKSNGLMYIIVPKGEHSIVLDYQTPGLTIGIYISIVSVLLFMLILAKENKPKLFIFTKKTED